MKSLLFPLSLLLLSFWSTISFAQGWERTYERGRFNVFIGITPTPDQGFIAIGTAHNSNTDLQEIYLLKAHADGSEQWSRFYGSSTEPLAGRSVIATDDGGWLLLGMIGPFSNPGRDVYLLKIDATGNEQWSQRLDYGPSEFARYIQATSDGGYFFNNSPDDGHLFVKVNNQGQEEWTYTVPESSPGTIKYPSNFMVLPDGYILSADVKLIKLDLAGNELWSISTPLKINNLYPTADGNFLIISEGAGGTQLLSKRDLNGTEIWNNTVKVRGDTRAVQVAETNDGGFMIVEVGNQFNGPSNIYFTSIVKTDSVGQQLFKKNLGSINGYNFALAKDNTGNLLFSGRKFIDPANSFDAFALVIKTNGNGDFYTSHITGTVFIDENENCNFESASEELLPSWWFVEAKGEQTFYGASDEMGNYDLVVDTGTYEVRLLASNPYWQGCSPSTVHLTSIDTTVQIDLAAQAEYVCPALTVDIASPFLRRCFENDYFVEYCNRGTAIAEDAYLEIHFDPNLNVISSTLSWTNQIDNLYTFELGNIAPGDCGSFRVRTEVDCDSTILGQTHCTTAHIFPDSICLPTDVSWDGSSIVVDADCETDSVRFTISNIGVGNMSEALNYIVVEDEIMVHQESFQLNSGQSTNKAFTATGATFRIEAQQAVGHPGNSSPSAAIEGCGAEAFSLGLINSFSQNDDNYFVSTDCQENIGSYDPNDKQAFPQGYSGGHWISPNEDLEYKIRFQNTGTDTAFNIVICDTISEWLEVNSIQMGIASHPYQFQISQGVLKITFSNILLPDSDTNEPASHGFVQYRIQQQPDNPIGTTIFNQAAIYFDFNPPIITNETYHQIATPWLSSTVITPPSPQQEVLIKVMPNPFQEFTIFDLTNVSEANLDFRLYDAFGQLLHKVSLSEIDQFRFDRQALSGGLYFYEFIQNGQRVDSGKLLLVD